MATAKRARPTRRRFRRKRLMLRRRPRCPWLRAWSSRSAPGGPQRAGAARRQMGRARRKRTCRRSRRARSLCFLSSCHDKDLRVGRPRPTASSTIGVVASSTGDAWFCVVAAWGEHTRARRRRRVLERERARAALPPLFGEHAPPRPSPPKPNAAMPPAATDPSQYACIPQERRKSRASTQPRGR